MFVDARTLPDGTRLEADLCVIGAGAAGITLARELGGGTLRVAVLESGGHTMDPDAQGLAAGEVAGLRYAPLMSARLRYFGGTTNHWGAVCRPFERWDFEPDPSVPLSGWPIRLGDLLPFYPRAAEVCGLAGLDELAQRPTDREFPAALSGAFEPHVVARVPTARRRLARTHRETIDRAGNVTVYLHANVLEVEADEPVRRATTVRATTFARNAFTVAARAFVLAAGGIEIARLLLLSRSRRPAGLGNDHDVVGRYFLEHPRFVAGIVLPDERALRPRMFEWRRVRRATLQTYMRLTPAVRAREGIGQVLLRFEPTYTYGADVDRAPAVRSLRSLVRSPAGDDLASDLAAVWQDLTTWQRTVIPGAPIPVPRPALVRAAIASPRAVKAHLPELAGSIPTFLYWKLGGTRTVTHVRVTTILLPEPNAASRVTLGRECDALGQPRARLDWRLTASDHRSVRRSMELLATELGRTGAGRLKLHLDRDEHTWPEDLRGGYHHMGTTRMSDDPRRGVVDRDCRVHGLANLYVAGSSAFPTSGSGTPTLALVALTLRLADHLKRTLA